MKHRVFDPLRLDVAAFAAEGGELAGEWPAAALPRLNDATHTEGAVDDTSPVVWRAQGRSEAPVGGQPQPWLHLEAETAVWLQCQRCLQPMRQPLAVQRDFRFVRSEAEAEAEDAESDEDVLALTRSLNLLELVEDELLLTLPLVPRHEVCPLPLPQLSDEPDEAAEPERPNPFAKLAELKRGRGS
jgi:uncharacterized protein